MTEPALQTKAIHSLAWKLFERSGAQLVQFAVNIVLARILLPQDYGAIALLTVFIALSQVFVQSGFSTALISKLDADDLDYSSVFYCTLAMSLLFYALLFAAAPFIARFYQMPVLKNALRVLALSIVLGTYNSLQNTYLGKNLLFKKLFVSSFSSTLVSGALGIAAAFFGAGIWALVLQQLSAILITTAVMCFTVPWHPKWQFSFRRLAILFSFGWKLLASGLLDTAYNNMYSVIIGKKYTAQDLAYWNRGKQFPAFLVTNINGSIGSVMFPVFSLQQNDLVQLKYSVRRSIQLSSFLVFPMMAGLAAVAKPLVLWLLTEKWLFCIPFLQAWCINFALMPIHTTNLQVYNSLGRSDIFLGLEIVKKVLGVGVLLITLPHGLKMMMVGTVCSGILCTFINAFPNAKVLGYPFHEQVMDLLPSFLLSLIMGAVVYGMGWALPAVRLLLPLQIIVGALLYWGESALFRLEPYRFCKGLLLSKLKAQKGR